MTAREILLSLVNECEECAMRGERIMCQTAPNEEMRLKCIDKVLASLRSLIKERIDGLKDYSFPHCKKLVRIDDLNKMVETIFD